MERRWLRDDQWQRLEPMLPGKASDPGRTVAAGAIAPEFSRTGIVDGF